MAMAVTFAAASRSTSAWFLPGHRKLMSVAPGRSRSASCTPSAGCVSGGCTFRTMSAWPHSSRVSATIVAPAFGVVLVVERRAGARLAFDEDVEAELLQPGDRFRRRRDAALART